jgi:hypothetical protein
VAYACIDSVNANREYLISEHKFVPAAASCGFVLVLCGLQAYWFYLICKVAIKQIRTGTAEDSRSDDEFSDDELEVENTKRQAQAPITKKKQ